MTFHRYQKLISGFFIINFIILFLLLRCLKINIPIKPYFICAGIISIIVPFFISERFYDYVEYNSFIWNSIYIGNLLILLIVMGIYIKVS